MLAAATALSARGKLRDASRTQRLRNADTDRSVLGMAAAAALALATAEDDGEDDARAQIAEPAAAAAQNVAVDAELVGRRITDAAFYFHRAGACDEELFPAPSAASSRRPGSAGGLYVSGDDIYPDDSRDACLGTMVEMMGAVPRIVLNAYERLAAAGCVCEETTAAAATAAGRLLPEDAPPRLVSYISSGSAASDARPQRRAPRHRRARARAGHENRGASGGATSGRKPRPRCRPRRRRCATSSPTTRGRSLLDLGCGLGAAARGWASDRRGTSSASTRRGP